MPTKSNELVTAGNDIAPPIDETYCGACQRFVFRCQVKYYALNISELKIERI